MLDPIEPAHFFPVFADVVAALRESGGLQDMKVFGGHTLIALDGTEFHCSDKIRCPGCSHRQRGRKGVEYFHTLLAATIVSPGHNRAVPLEPAFVAPQDGHEKQDCESRAARRWLAAHGTQYLALKPIYLGDDLFSRQPICEAVREAGGQFLFVCKPDSHPAIEEFRAGIVLDEKRERVRRGRRYATHRYRWLCDVPLRADAKAMSVNWLEIEITDAEGAITYRNSFITDLPVTAATVAELAACGRARWKIENETFNVLKTKGYNLEHNFGHGKQHLASVLATLNLLAFAFHTACDLGDRTWKAARRELVTRQGFFQTLSALTAYVLFSSWHEILEAMAFRRPMPQGP
jgi:hypothetical protein